MFMGEYISETNRVQADSEAVLNFRFELRKDQVHTHMLSSSAALVYNHPHDDRDAIAPVSVTSRADYTKQAHIQWNDMDDIPMSDQAQGKHRDSADHGDQQWRGLDGKLNVL